MMMSVQTLWYIYIFTLLILLFVLYVVSGGNVASVAFFSTLLAALLIMILSRVYFYQGNLDEASKHSLEVLTWFSWGLVVVVFVWYVITFSSGRGHLIEKATYVCDENGECRLEKMEEIGVNTTLEGLSRKNDLRKRQESPLQTCHIKYLA